VDAIEHTAADAHVYAHLYANPDADRDLYPQPDADAHGYTGANRFIYTIANQDSGPADTHADQNADAYGLLHTNGNTVAVGANFDINGHAVAIPIHGAAVLADPAGELR
jgi:hypothetical protein